MLALTQVMGNLQITFDRSKINKYEVEMRRKVKLNDICWQYVGQFLTNRDILKAKLVNWHFNKIIVPNLTFFHGITEQSYQIKKN